MSEPKRKIKFKTLDNKITELEVDPKLPITELKKIIQEKFNAPPQGQRLIFKGKQMKDGQTLDEHIKKDDEIIHLMFKTPEQLSNEQNQNQNTNTNANQTSNQNPNPNINPFGGLGNINIMDIFNNVQNMLSTSLQINPQGQQSQGQQSQGQQSQGQQTQNQQPQGNQQQGQQAQQSSIPNLFGPNVGNINLVLSGIRPGSITATNINTTISTGNSSSNQQNQQNNPEEQNNNNRISIENMNDNNSFPIQISETDRRYENFLRQINLNISNCINSLQNNDTSIPLPLLNTTQNILTSLSRTLRYYILGLQDIIPHLMRLSELFEREQFITETDVRRKGNELIKKCVIALNEITRSSKGLTRVLNTTNFGPNPNTGFVSVVAAEVGSITTEIPIRANVQITSTQVPIPQNITNNINTTGNIAPTQQDQTNINPSTPTQPQQQAQPPEQSQSQQTQSNTNNTNTNTNSNQNQSSNQTQNTSNQGANPFGNIMAQVFRPENLNNIMGMVDSIMGGGESNQNNNSSSNPFANLVNSIVSQMEQSDQTGNQNQVQPSQESSSTQNEQHQTEVKKEEEKEKPKETNDLSKGVEKIKTIMANSNLRRETHMSDIEKDIPINPHKEFASFTKKIISHLTLQEIIQMNKLNIIGITRQRKEIQSLIQNLPSSIEKVTELISEGIILIENELDKLSPNKSFDIDVFFKKHITEILNVIVNDKLQDSEWEDTLLSTFLKMILELYKNLIDLYQTGKEGAKYCLEFNLEGLFTNLLGKDFLNVIHAYNYDFMTNFIENVIGIAENDEMKREMTSNDNTQDRLLSIDDIFKVAMNDKKKLENENNNNTQEKFSEIYYRTSLFQD